MHLGSEPFNIFVVLLVGFSVLLEPIFGVSDRLLKSRLSEIDFGLLLGGVALRLVQVDEQFLLCLNEKFLEASHFLPGNFEFIIKLVYGVNFPFEESFGLCNLLLHIIEPLRCRDMRSFSLLLHLL